MKKKVLAMLMAVVMLVASSVSALASYDPTGYNGYANYGNNGFSYWCQDLAEEYGATPTVYSPQAYATRAQAAVCLSGPILYSMQDNGVEVDVYRFAPFYDCNDSLLNQFARLGLINGDASAARQTTFRPTDLINRAEFATMIVNCASKIGLIEYNRYVGYNNFPNDVKETDWYYDEVNLAYELGFMNGTGYGSFSPTEKVTNEMAFAVSFRWLETTFGIEVENVQKANTVSWAVQFDGEYEDSYNSSSSVKVSKLTPEIKTVYLEVGEEYELSAEIYPTKATKKTVVWTIQDEDVAEILDYTTKSSKSKTTVEFVALEEGTTYLVGKTIDGSKITTKVKLVVGSGEEEDDDTVYVSSIRVTPSEVEMEIGDSQVIEYSVYPKNATNAKIVWKSYNKNVVTVNSKGKLTAVGVGSTTVTATAKDGSGVVADIEVTVTAEDISVPDDDTAPIVAIEFDEKYVDDEGYVHISQNTSVSFYVTAEDESLKKFNLTAKDIIGLPDEIEADVEIVSDDTYKVTLIGSQVTSAEFTVEAGVAVDESGNKSEQPESVVIYVEAEE